MTDADQALPWSSLRLSQSEIPWDDLHVFADAAVRSKNVRRRLMDAADRSSIRSGVIRDPEGIDLSMIAVPAVFALAAEQLDGEGRREAAEYLIGLLYHAGREGDDYLLETLERAAGRLGRALIDPARRLIDRHGSSLDCWFSLWTLLRVADDADPATRDDMARLCRRIIREAPDRYERYSCASAPARLLAALDPDGGLPLVRSLFAESDCPDLGELIAESEGRKSPLPDRADRPWIEPVEQWLPREHARMLRWLSSPDSDLGADFEGPDVDGAASADGNDVLSSGFFDSPAFFELPEEIRGDAGLAAIMFAQGAMIVHGAKASDLTPEIVRKVLVEDFPREAAEPPGFFERAPRGIVAFLNWLGEQGELADPAPLCEAVHDATEAMLERSRDRGVRSAWDPATMSDGDRGTDGFSTDPLGRTAAGPVLPRLTADDVLTGGDEPKRDHGWPGRPVDRPGPKVPRNAPCPCGSGKKYKKCCGM